MLVECETTRTFFEGFVKVKCYLFFTPVDCSGRRENSCGLSWSGETPQE